MGDKVRTQHQVFWLFPMLYLTPHLMPPHATSCHRAPFLVPSSCHSLHSSGPPRWAGGLWCVVLKAMLPRPDVLASRSRQGTTWAGSISAAKNTRGMEAWGLLGVMNFLRSLLRQSRRVIPFPVSCLFQNIFLIAPRNTSCQCKHHRGTQETSHREHLLPHTL